MVIFGVFAACIFSEPRVQYVSDLHLKFALRPHHVLIDIDIVWKYGRHPMCDG